ncbi:ferrichrome ABC transporter permease [Pelistega indica]|uniref:Ferrichrome ABC transporter permease n=1 Tax=Pelistega indica TaxID=1414851 RepID=V8G936_9BURK|nr:MULTISPECIES: iron ABC transporter permease [Pelistega]ETD72217.1 ferrichrome ABC transporter permease [Pelistega indica]
MKSMLSTKEHIIPQYTSWKLIVGWAVLALISIFLAIFLGVVDIPISDILATFTGQGSSTAQSIIMDIRLPRIITGMLAGVHLSVAGFILQTITRNLLADPSIMGISQGATLAITIFLLFTVYTGNVSESQPVMPIAWLPGIGMIGGLIAGVIIYFFALQRELGPLRITLCGIAIGAILHAIALGLMVGWGSHRIEVVLEWLSGSLYARSWQHVLFLLPFTVFGLLSLPLLSRPLNLLHFETTVAQSFGLSYKRHFSFALILACSLAASAVGVVGPIIFVGLIAPHLARFIAGRHLSLVLPLSIVSGIIIVTFSDLIGRMVGQDFEIPIGVVTALCGVPLLITLLRRTI